MLEDKHYEEAVLKDNKFHRQLSDVRNGSINQNHPDVSVLFQEHKSKVREEQVKTLLSSLTGLNSVPQPERLPKVEEPSELAEFAHIVKALDDSTTLAIKTGSPLTLCVIAFPDLNTIKNQLGHESMKKVKELLARKVIESVCMDNFSIGEHYNDRLILVLPEIPRTLAKILIQRVQVRLSEEYTCYKHLRFRSYARIGMSCTPDHGETWQELLARADLAVDALVEKTLKASRTVT